MDIEELVSRFAVALGVGLLIGLERGWTTRTADPGSRTAGIRTFAVTALLGGVTAALARTVDGAGAALVLGLGFAAYATAITLFCRDENRQTGSLSATTAVAAMLTFALGAYALLGDLTIAAAVSVATAGLLAMRGILHDWVERITWPELRSALVLLAMTFIILPIVPAEPVGPFGGVVLREVWLIAIVLAGVSFAGYLAVKYFGASHGILLAAFAGGLVSSTAVTATNARRAAEGEGAPRLLAAGVALAAAVSFLRVIAIVAVLNTPLLILVAPPLGAAVVTAAAFALGSVYLRKSDEQASHEVAFRNPFGFWSVVGFAALLGAIIMIGRFLGEGLGPVGAVIGAAALGLADVDAVTVSMTRLAPQPLSAQVAAYAILAAVASNTMAKLALGAVLGRGRFAVLVAIMSLAAIMTAGVALWLTSVLVR